MIDYRLHSMTKEDLSLVSRGNDLAHTLSTQDIAFKSFIGYTIVDNSGNILCIVMMRTIFKRVGEGAIIMTPEGKQYPLTLVRAVKEIIDKVNELYHYKRLQITVSCDGNLLKWGKILGFKLEGRMIKYGIDGSDHYLMAKTWD